MAAGRQWSSRDGTRRGAGQSPPALHLPPAHLADGWQRTPHAPQLRSSFIVDTQMPPQRVSPPGHGVRPRQVPATQASPAEHASPQAPQLAELVFRSTHALPHAVCPAPQLS